MKSVFDGSVKDELLKRFEMLQPNSARQWGKMMPAQMLAHCTETLRVPVGDLKVKRTFASLIGWMFKGMATSEKPFSKNSPTADEFMIRDTRDFDAEKKRFAVAFEKLARGPSSITCLDHPFFGKMSATDWGHLMYKHLDHHLRQFGV